MSLPCCVPEGYVVQKHWKATQERVEKFLSDTYFTDVNLRGRLYFAHAPLQSIKWSKSESGKLSFDEAKLLLEHKGMEITGAIGGFKIGPAWSTHWFECTVVVPIEWSGHQVRFRWDSSSEAMIWIDGHPVQGLTGSSDSFQLRTDYTLTERASGGERFTLYVEAAANGMFGAGKCGLINPPDPAREFSLILAEVAAFDQDVYDLMMDMTVLYDMSKHLPSDSPRAFDALYTANKIVNACDPFDKKTFTRCREIAARFLGERNGDSQHRIHAIGHCHIDSAWLWPYSETRRKCGRSWASTLLLMDKYPEFKFACSQAQQLDWVKQDYPSLYRRIQEKAKAGQFIPVGGTWIEMDGNIPSGESFVRQFLLGQRFFKQEFGNYCKEFWLPDTFGYSAQLPQVMKGAGIKYFLTQKLSWNFTNTFPHNSFMWEGLDGSQVLAHFPPADTYESKADVSDVLKTVEKLKDKGKTRHSMLLYGHGDGGGGPTDNMLELIKRMKDVDGLPIVEHSSPEHFFNTVEAEHQQQLCKWVGELYLELHRGTFTSQAKIKLENRRIEFLLHDVDFIESVRFIVGAQTEWLVARGDDMCSLWEQFLLNQFHDVIPGSCIEQVVIDALEIYNNVKSKAGAVLNSHFKAVVSELFPQCPEPSPVLMNSFSWQRCGVLKVGTHEDSNPSKRPRLNEEEAVKQVLADGSVLSYVVCPPMSIGELERTAPKATVSLVKIKEEYVLENGVLVATLNGGGLLKSLIHKGTQKEAIDGETGLGNQFVLFDDVPLFWDAWDVMEYHLETRRTVGSESIHSASIIETGPLRAILKVEFAISDKTTVTQEITLDADSQYLEFHTKVSWYENHKFLKVEFPLNVRSHEAKYDIQFGHISRPTHFNTTWDQARFEVCGHKWADLSEHGFGVALLNDCKYGYSALDNILRLSLLRSPKAPDGNCDMGDHIFSYALMPHSGTVQDSGVIQQASNFNHPMKAFSSPFYGPARTFLSVDNPAVVIDTVKLPADYLVRRGLVVRMYEAHGGHAVATLKCNTMLRYQKCNLLEEAEGALEEGTVITLNLRPFQVITYFIQCVK